MRVASKAGPHVKMQCHHCSKILKVENELRGTPIQCAACDNYMVVPKHRFEPYMVFDDFIVRAKLGEGNMGAVYRAQQRSLDRQVALKILHKEHNKNDQLLATLQREARVAAKLNHPSIVQCYSVGDADGIFYYAMEYVEGKTLKQLLDKKWKLPADQSIRIIRQIASALDYAWREVRLVHRDIKPENIILTADDHLPKLTDLGLASPAPDLKRTGEEDIQGTPPYVCPEEVLGRPLDMRSDIYSLGAVLYHAVTGHLPFTGESPEEIVVKHVKAPLTSPSTHAPELPQPLVAIIEQMMAKQPSDRYQDWPGVIAALDALPVLSTASTNSLPRPPSLSSGIYDARTANLERTVEMVDDRPHPRSTLPPQEIEEEAPAPPPAAVSSQQWIWIGTACAVMIIMGAMAIGWMIVNAESLPPPRQPVVDQQPAAVSPPPAPNPTSAPGATAATAPAALYIIGLLPNPVGMDLGHEQIRLLNQSGTSLDLAGYWLEDAERDRLPLSGTIAPGETLTITVPAKTLRLNNTGDSVQLHSPSDQLLHAIQYDEYDVEEGIFVNRRPPSAP